MRKQSLRPNTIFVADGGSTTEYLERIRHSCVNLPLKIKVIPGTPITTKNGSLDDIDEDITAFLDSDEIAPPDWLMKLTEPIALGSADFTGGPTKPAGEAKSKVEMYYNELEKRIYEGDVEQDIVYIPLGNTAWRTSLLKKLRFDSTIVFRGGAPDYDLEMRAVDAGYKGVFVREAWVYHNKSTSGGYSKLIKHRYRYLVGAAVVMIKNDRLKKRLSEKRKSVKMPFAYVEAAMKPIALIHAYVYWNLVVKRK